MDLYINKHKFLRYAKGVILDFDEDLISRAWDFAEKAHGTQERESGATYFSHPVGVAYNLLATDCDSATLAAALLHDIVEDTEHSLEEIQDKFGKSVASLVKGVTKLKRLDDLSLGPEDKKGKLKSKIRNASLTQLFISIVEDPRVAMIKIADRLHNLTTLGALPEEKQKRIARESLDLFAPLAEALGFGRLHSEIQNLAFRYLEPEIYQELSDKIEQRRQAFEETQQVAIQLLEDELKKQGLPQFVYGRQKEVYSIYRKMITLGLDFEQVHDIIGIRIIVDTKEQCYIAKGLVDQLGVEVKSINYIAYPKRESGYQSLHKIVQDSPQGMLIEVQIRTKEMHDLAERGKCAHWMYKLKTSADPGTIEKVTYLRERLEALKKTLIELDEDEDITPDELEANVREALAPQIRVLTPAGKIIELPEGSTPIDFAYHIHTQVGHECRGAKVNGKQVALDYRLEDGDTVQIIPQKGGEPNLYWVSEEQVKSKRAERKILSYFRRQKRTQLIEHGQKMARKRLKALHDFSIGTEELVSKLFQEHLLAIESEEAFYLAIAESRLNFDRIDMMLGSIVVERCLKQYALSKDVLSQLAHHFVAKNLIPAPKLDLVFGAIIHGEISSESLEKAVREIAEKPPGASIFLAKSHPVSSVQANGLFAHVAKCCYPLPGDTIIGYVSVGHGLTIHRDICPQAIDQERQERTVAIDWKSLAFPANNHYSSELRLSIELSRVDTKFYEKLQGWYTRSCVKSESQVSLV